MIRRALPAFATLLSLVLTQTAQADPRCAHYDPQRQVFFGDLHVHTRYSLDAATQGTRTRPDDAYAFAKGAALGIQPWRDGRPTRRVQLRRPLDFAMVSDHAELMGEVDICSEPDRAGHNAWQCRLYRGWPFGAYIWFNYWSSQQAQRLNFCVDAECGSAALGPWEDVQAAAARHYDTVPNCGFTTFVGYEWTGGFAGDAAGNVHRNVLFRSAKVPALPISFMDQQTPKGLYAQLDSGCGDGCEALVIPHNSNLSAGLMFTPPASVEEASARARYETLAEIMQHKGSSECYFDPLTSTDELCAFEQLGERSFIDSSPPRPDDGFLRAALREGLRLQGALGVNPFQFGFVGSSDTHLGTPGLVAEDQFPGHGGAGRSARRSVPVGLPDHLRFNPGGLVGVWAEENRRGALFDALRRREAYATSGPRLQVRLFAGENLAASLCSDPDLVAKGYAQGVPMGGELSTSGGLSVLVQATADAADVGLEALQIVKGWVDRNGVTHERVFDIARSDVVHDLDLASCEVRGRSAASLCQVWRDPEFNPQQAAFYYARVLQGPSCRWSQRLCAAAGVRCDDATTMVPGMAACCVANHRRAVRERAWTSPVWHTPQ